MCQNVPVVAACLHLLRSVECSGSYCKSSIASGSAQDILLMKKRDGSHLFPSTISIILIQYNLPAATLMKLMGTAYWYSYTIPHTFQYILCKEEITLVLYTHSITFYNSESAPV